MATFPTLTPATRTFTPGEYPHTAYITLSNLNRRVLHTNAMVASTLRVTFTQLSQADMLSVVSHYQGQQGAFLPFAIPSSLLRGFTAADFTLTGYQWRYVEPPQIVDFCGPFHDVSVTLESVAPEAMVASGLDLTVTATLAAGAATAGSTAPAATLTVTATLDAGAATASSEAPAADLTVTVTLDAGAASTS